MVTSSVSLYRVGVASDVSVDTVAFRGINPINIPSSHSPVPSVVLVTAATQKEREHVHLVTQSNAERHVICATCGDVQ